jgi:hypothetical protein
MQYARVRSRLDWGVREGDVGGIYYRCTEQKVRDNKEKSCPRE